MRTNPQSTPSFEGFLVRPFSEFSRDTLQRRGHAVNIIVASTMLTACELEFSQRLTRLCDLAAEIVSYHRGIVFFWDKERPLLIQRGQLAQVDSLLDAIKANSVLVVPLFARACVLGSLQLFGDQSASFTEEDAQLLWAFSHAFERLLGCDCDDEAIVQLASRDCLTGLKTRRHFEAQLDREFKRAERSGSPLALVIIDIDDFKMMNDTHGHYVGDMLLRQISSTLMKELREIDTLARYGGDEFVAILPDTTSTSAAHVAERLNKRVEAAPLFTAPPSRLVHLTISLGVASFPQEAKSQRELFEAADAALYDAKRAGRNRVVLYSGLKGSRDRRNEERLRLALPVRVWGMDVAGDLFEQDATTVDVARTGTRLRGITSPLEKGSIISVRQAKHKERFRVMWLGDEGTPVSGELGLQLVDLTRTICEL